MNEQFPLTLAAVKKGENFLWDIGDALIKECQIPPSEHGVNDGSRSQLDRVSKYLSDNGFTYSVQYLSALRNTAYNFRSNDRISGLAWGTHKAAGNPETLKAIIAGAKGKKISQIYVEDVLRAQYLAAQAKQRAAAEEARKEREKAEAKEAEAHRKAQEAKEAAERARAEEKEAKRAEHARAEAKAKKAASQTHEARQKEQAAKVAPKRREGPPPDPEEQPIMLASALFLGNAHEAAILAEKAKESILPHIDDISRESAPAYIEAVLEAVNAWREVGELFEKSRNTNRSHLSVVGQ